jgi:hypothetical protein
MVGYVPSVLRAFFLKVPSIEKPADGLNHRPRMDVSIFGETLLNAAASRLRLLAQRGKVVLSGLGHLVGEAGATHRGVRLLSAPKNQVVPGRGLHEEGQEALIYVPAHTEVPGVNGTRP